MLTTTIVAPPSNASKWQMGFNSAFKGLTTIRFSVVLLVLVDANYKFTLIDVGGYGKVSDGGLLTRSILEKSLETNTLNIPNSKPPPNSEEPQPCISPKVIFATTSDIASVCK